MTRFTNCLIRLRWILGFRMLLGVAAVTPSAGGALKPMEAAGVQLPLFSTATGEVVGHLDFQTVKRRERTVGPYAVGVFPALDITGARLTFDLVAMRSGDWAGVQAQLSFFSRATATATATALGVLEFQLQDAAQRLVFHVTEVREISNGSFLCTVAGPPRGHAVLAGASHLWAHCTRDGLQLVFIFPNAPSRQFQFRFGGHQ